MSKGIEFEDYGTSSPESCDYADFAHPCAEAVESGREFPGIGICGSGNGINMTLNKHQGIRSALCWPPSAPYREDSGEIITSFYCRPKIPITSFFRV